MPFYLIYKTFFRIKVESGSGYFSWAEFGEGGEIWILATALTST